MKLKRVIINNFRSFGETQVININNQTVFVGNNSTGKTNILQALNKLFSSKQSDRIIQKSDFHLSKGLPPGENSRELFIETIFEFEELENDTYSSAIPSFFEHFTVSKEEKKPFLRIRLESSWEDDGTIEGSIDTQVYYILSDDSDIKEEDKHPAHRRDLDRIRILYVPAVRNPEKELGNASGSMLSRLVKSINWTEDEIEEIKKNIISVNDTILSEDSGLKKISREIQKSWEIYYKDKKFSKAELIVNSFEINSALKQISLIFSPTNTKEPYTVLDLGDGLRSIFYFSLVDSILSIESKIAEEYKKSPENSRFKLIPPILTILAIEEPENHIAPHHIGKLVHRFEQLSMNSNSQVMLTSHSPAIVKRIEPENLRYLRIENSDKVFQTLVSQIYLPEDNEESYKYIKGAIQAYPELYFSKLVIFGEGDSEEMLLPRFFDLLGKEIDSSQISIIPLGGRHVNYFWKLLSTLQIPYITLLDLDNERYGGGWGRIKYVIQNLLKNGTHRESLVKLKDGRVLSDNEIDNLDKNNKLTKANMLAWIKHLERFNVFFSEPLDIDFLMLKHYGNHYIGLLSQNEGPTVSYFNRDKTVSKIKVIDVDRNNNSQKTGLENRIEDAKRATLKKKSGTGDSFSEEETELMIWYQYFFLGRGKPITHFRFLTTISEDKLENNIPSVFTKMVKCAENLLEDNEHGEK